MIIVESKKKNMERLGNEYPGTEILDVTSKSEDEWIYLSPFYPHGSIPVPFSPEWTAESVEGIWQGLKVFEKKGVDVKVMHLTGLEGIKRSSRSLGKCLGHQKGLESTELLDYIEARKQIYVPSYFWMLENYCQPLLEKIRQLSRHGVVVLLDYDTNPDIDDPSSPLSHASLIVRYLQRSLTEAELAAWPGQEAEMLKRRKERKAQLKKQAEAKQSQWAERVTASNPSRYTPVWVKAEQKAHDVSFLFFWKPATSKSSLSRGCLSQWHLCEFSVGGTTYQCAEQYMMAEKARIFGDEATRQRILAESDPEAIKKLGREVQNFDAKVWDQQKFDVVVQGNLAKFGQNPALRKYLLSTGVRILVEASPFDRIWGIGMREDDKDVQKPERWFGTNLLGFALMVVRDELARV